MPTEGEKKKQQFNDLIYFSQHRFKKKTLLIISVNLFEVFWKELLVDSRKSPR